MQASKWTHCNLHVEEAKEVKNMDLVAEYKIPSTL